MTPLHVHRYGPAGPLRLLALHGLTGHGKRWESLATRHLSEIAVAAPDLIGHGRSTWAAPWTIDANVAALAELLEQQADGPVVVVAHSFGCAVALHLAAAHPDRVAALVLLDPAIGLDGGWMQEIADAMLASPDYTDAAEARAAKANGSWAEVDPAVLDAELDEHLVVLPGGRYSWRLSLPAMMSYWSELAREIILPPKGIGTTLVQAAWTSPSYVNDRLDRRPERAAGGRFSAVDVRMRSHGGRDQTCRGRRTDPRADELTVAPVTDEQVERVRALVASIPPGRVSTYGDIAAAAGLSSPRIVGWIMRTDSSDLPWHRVITASGRPARHLTTRQLELLRAEGVLALDGRVALDEVRYEFPT